MTACEGPLTAEDCVRRPDPGYPEELVEGRLVRRRWADARHGFVCGRVPHALSIWARGEDRGRVLAISGVVTRRSPDTVRSADATFYSFDRLPRGPLPDGYPDVPPGFVVEVRSEEEPWRVLLTKVAEFLNVGARAVVVLDPETHSAQVFEAESGVRVLSSADTLELPGVLPGFRVEVRRFFEGE